MWDHGSVMTSTPPTRRRTGSGRGRRRDTLATRHVPTIIGILTVSVLAAATIVAWWLPGSRWSVGPVVAVASVLLAIGWPTLARLHMPWLAQAVLALGGALTPMGVAYWKNLDIAVPLTGITLVALVAAPVYHTMLSKSPSGTPIFIAAILPSLILIASGHIPIAPLVSVPVGIAAVLIARKGQYKSFRWNAASHAVFSWNLLGGFVPIWFMRDYFFQDTFERGMSADFCDTLYALTPDWMFLAMMLAIVVFSLAGSLIARKLLAGRLESAGIL